MKTSCGPLRGLYPKDNAEADLARRMVRELDTVADPKWIAQRAVSLLTHYFVAEAHPGAMANVARDWQRELATYPEWAIEAACAWWVSKANSKRGKKPMPGDISERCDREVSILKAAKTNLAMFDRHGEHPPAHAKIAG